MADDNNDTVGLFLRAMVDREPGKRKVKPSKSALIDLAELDLGESSDDSDYKVDEAKLKEDDDISINSDIDDNDEEDSEEDGDSSEENGEDRAPVSNSNVALSNKEKNVSVNELIAQAEEKQSNALKQGITRPKILVCAVCLAENSDDVNEIVTCDGCHLSVHEGCYGISDAISVSSTVSSSSTEPWFCDACKAGVSNPNCELCPNLGHTIFKETEMGRWVHLVCALYIPGVAFSEVDKLSFPTLFEMPYSRYGSKTCSLCEDERYCKTGVCIGCDAGMCRAYFHVTCAQREGLLSEVNHYEADQADPYYAHCRLHTDRELMRRRRRNWVALQLHVKEGRRGKDQETTETKERLGRKLIKYREKYALVKANRPPPWRPTQKMPRPLSTCASLFRSLVHKTSLMGLETDSKSFNVTSVGDIRKKWHIAPAFSVEFISYFLDRGSRMKQLKDKMSDLMKESEELTTKENSLRTKYHLLKKEHQSIQAEGVDLLNKSLEIHDLLKGLAGRPLRLPPVVAALHNPPCINTVTDRTGKEKPLITKAATKMMTSSIPSSGPEATGNELKNRPKLSANYSCNGSREGAEHDVMRLRTCFVCGLSNDQHLIIECDTCVKFYHLGCLDPPLARMPKKSKQMGWQCSDCCKSSDSDKTPEVDIAGPRKLRRPAKDIDVSVLSSLNVKNGICSSTSKSKKPKSLKSVGKRRRSSESSPVKGSSVRRRSLDLSPKGPSLVDISTSCGSADPPSSSCGTPSLEASGGECLSSPASESFPFDEDLNSKKEHRHRHDGAKKKKKDRDKEENRKRRKHHHRHRYPSVSEMPFSFKLKIKPLPPRPSTLDSSVNNIGADTPSASTDDQLNCVHTCHTTSTTTAPPGYPPLPPGYTLTQPVMIPTPEVGLESSKTTVPQRPQDSKSVSSTHLANTAKAPPANSALSSAGGFGRRKSDSGAAKQFSTCDVCGEAGGVTNTVVCDECLKAYHFNCLEPPLKKSPKRRGYSWFCEDCGTTSSSKSSLSPVVINAKPSST